MEKQVAGEQLLDAEAPVVADLILGISSILRSWRAHITNVLHF
jgi:hypothetical protein